MNSRTFSSDIESSPASSRSSSGRTGRLRAMIVALMKSVTALATSSGCRERCPVDMMEITILMRLLLCKSYEMPPRPDPSNVPGGDEHEARQKQGPAAHHAGLAVGFDVRHRRPGAVARR